MSCDCQHCDAASAWRLPGSGGLGRRAAPGKTEFNAVFISPSLTPFCFGAGALTAFLAAVYLTLEARENQLREDFRRRALSAAFVVFAAAAGTLALALTDAPLMGRGLTATPWAVPLHLTTGAAAVAAIYTLWKRRYVLAPVAAAVQVSLILWVGGWHSTHISFRLRLRLQTRLPRMSR